MKADLTRDTFDPAKHYSRVLMQQGRVTLDADWNEQASIFLDTLRKMANDIIGPFAGPTNNCGFQLSSTGAGNLTLSPGRYYVDGIMVEADTSYTYGAQPFYMPPSTDPVMTELGQKTSTNGVYWLYLDVWEWHLTYLSDSSIREVALNGPDTCTRAMVVWQVKSVAFNAQTEDVNGVPVQTAPGQIPQNDSKTCQQPLRGLMSVSSGIMGARVNPGQIMDSPCITPPSAKYRGLENQLYRVEVHIGGDATTATFKWSRDNGSIVTSVLSQTGNVLTVGQSRDFSSGNWVELLDDNLELLGTPGALVKLSQAGNGTLTVDPSSLASGTTLDAIYAALDQTANPRAIRWDQIDTSDEPLTAGAIPIVESIPTNATWTDLEDGVQVAFSSILDEGQPAHQYRTGDYWLIPARVATGDIEWPIETNAQTSAVTPIFMPPSGIEHHYAPLGFVSWSGGTFSQSTCSCTFAPIAMCTSGDSQAPEQRIVADDPVDFNALEKAEVRAQGQATKAKKPAAT